MLGKDKLIIVVFAAVVVLVLGGGIWLLAGNKSAGRKILTETPGPAKGDVGFQEPQTKVAVGSKAVSSGTFVKVEGGKIYFTEEGVTTALPLTAEVSVQCTNQNLTGVDEYDFDQVTKINVVAPTELGSKIAVGEPVVVLANLEGAEYRGNTVAVSADKCSF